jgi:hypothetical protein
MHHVGALERLDQIPEYRFGLRESRTGIPEKLFRALESLRVTTEDLRSLTEGLVRLPEWKKYISMVDRAPTSRDTGDVAFPISKK